MLRNLSLVLTMLVALGSAAGCVSRYAAGDHLEPARLREHGWISVEGVHPVRQRDREACGVAAVAMVQSRLAPGTATAPIDVPEGGLHARDLREMLRRRGLQAFIIEGTVEDLRHELAAGRPVIVGTVTPVGPRKRLQHYEVVVGYHPGDRMIATIDPATGWRIHELDEFEARWRASGHVTVVALPPEA